MPDRTRIDNARAKSTARQAGAAGATRGETTVVDAHGQTATVAVNLAESPLRQLASRRGADGHAYLQGREVDAGERLRLDFTIGCMMPRLGANWDAPVSRGGRGAASATADITDAALAARQRVDAALRAVGPELSGVLVDVCCFLKGLELVERERSWPARSAKLVLKTALAMLARHYFPASRDGSGDGIRHWGADGYRPELNSRSV
jgi:hypothetical protein